MRTAAISFLALAGLFLLVLAWALTRPRGTETPGVQSEVVSAQTEAGEKSLEEKETSDAKAESPAESPFVVNGMVVEMPESWKLPWPETKAIVELAMEELGDYGYDRNAPLTVEEDGPLFFTVTFPEPPHEGPSDLVERASFAAKVRIFKETRKVEFIFCGG